MWFEPAICVFFALTVWLLWGIRSELRRLSFWSGPREERSAIPDDIMRKRLDRARANALLEERRTKEDDDDSALKRNRRGTRTPSKLGM